MPITLFESVGMLAPAARAVLLTFAAVLWTVLLVRIVGLRAFSKMTAFDFVTTVATGSLIAQAGTRTDWLDYLQSVAAIGAVFLAQWLLARARLMSPVFKSLIQNEPVFLMEDGRFLDAAMATKRVSRSNVLEKLRSSGVSRIEDVRAVVLETTGDISVLAGGPIDPRMIEGVRHLPQRATT